MKASSRTWLAATLAPLVWASVACSSASPGSSTAAFPSDPYATTTSDSGSLILDLRTSPQPPSRGTNDVQLTITRAADGTPVDNLTLQIEPWMPAMGHGTSSPTVAAQGGGVYLVTEVYFYMPGTWELRTSISGAMTDHATAQLTIQ